MSRRDLGTWAIFRAPIIVFGFAMAGLVGALLGDGVWDGLGAAGLASTVVVLAWALARRRR